jgi:hypothetical protein
LSGIAVGHNVREVDKVERIVNVSRSNLSIVSHLPFAAPYPIVPERQE